TPKSGSEFTKGVTTVSCTATDTAGNASNCSFTVTVNDCEVPKITCPANIVQCKDPAQTTMAVNYTVNATDNCGSAAVVLAPVSGSQFAKGVTPVSCTATDAAGNHSNCSFTVTVNDCTVLTITCPGDVTVCADSGKCSAVVPFSPTTTGNSPVVAC